MKDISLLTLKELSKFDKVVKFILVGGILAVSGVRELMVTQYFVMLFGLSVVFGIYYKVNLKQYIKYFLAFGILVFIQTLYFGQFYMNTAFLQLIIFSAGMLIAGIVGADFVEVFVKIMLFFSVISLILFVPILIYHPFADILYNSFPIHYQRGFENAYGKEVIVRSIFFLNYMADFDVRTRNTGPFWEPGAFGGYLLMCYVLNTIRTKSLFSRSNLIIAITIITTFSTTAYLAFFVFISAYAGLQIKSIALRVILVVSSVALFIFLFNNLDFLSKKISDEYNDLEYIIRAEGGNTRTASTYLDLTEFVEKDIYVFIGRGAHPETRVARKYFGSLRTNGDTDQLVRWGLPFFIFYFWGIWKTFLRFCEYYDAPKTYALIGLGIILVVGMSENYYRYSFMWMLFLLHPAVANYLKRKEEQVPATHDFAYN